MTPRELRDALILECARRTLLAFKRHPEVEEPIAIIARPQGDPLARSLVRFVGARVTDGVAVFVMERATFLRRLGPAVHENIARAVRAGMPQSGAPWVLCIAHGGATMGEGELIVIGPAGDASMN